MEQWKGTSEEFVKQKGWKLIKGYRIDTEQVADMDQYDNLYFEDLTDFVIKAEYWQHPTDYESVYEDVDQLIECEYEEYFDEQDNLYNEPVQNK